MIQPAGVLPTGRTSFPVGVFQRTTSPTGSPAAFVYVQVVDRGPYGRDGREAVGEGPAHVVAEHGINAREESAVVVAAHVFHHPHRHHSIEGAPLPD
jgi:hypothetical protein